MVESLRLRYQQCRRANASLEGWRALQLEILDVVKQLQRHVSDREHTASATRESKEALWALLGDAFWLERDLSRLDGMIERVLVEMERHEATVETQSSF